MGPLGSLCCSVCRDFTRTYRNSFRHWQEALGSPVANQLIKVSFADGFRVRLRKLPGDC
jgi:hypothetical protein